MFILVQKMFLFMVLALVNYYNPNAFYSYIHVLFNMKTMFYLSVFS